MAYGLGVVVGRCYFAERRRFESPVTFAIHVRKSPGSAFEPWPSSQLVRGSLATLHAGCGSPAGLTGKAVKLVIPEGARAGNDWPDQPVCGDFDGDGAEDLVVHASDGRLSYLRGPFTRKGAPRAAGRPLPSPGTVPTGPALDVNRDGYDDLLVRTAEGPATSALVLGGPAGPTRTGTALPSGIDVALGRFGRGRALDAAVDRWTERICATTSPPPYTTASAPPGRCWTPGTSTGTA
ncbi:FG-GAP repeat domain-containing protein [Streptomyces mirabilis]|uniref:FG-GAP repeat domain-containing protein n=1 Tax=Streptomyces mirabilis TaxID=68239 RepID=UPI00362A409C